MELENIHLLMKISIFKIIFLFNLFSVGVLYIVLLLMILIIAFSKSYKTGLKVLLFLIVISLSVYEDLLPIYGFFLGSMFKINKNENK